MKKEEIQFQELMRQSEHKKCTVCGASSIGDLCRDCMQAKYNAEQRRRINARRLAFGPCW